MLVHNDMDKSVTLRLNKVSKDYTSGDDTIRVLHSISLELLSGERWAIIGPSGSGKSTLLGIAAGLDTQTSGEVELCGRDLRLLDEDDKAVLRRDEVGFVFQSFHLIPTLTALENVMLPLELRGERNPDHARSLLASFGLKDRTHHYPSQLSGGEQQRVTLARAFINTPKILFADEPTGNLDQTNATLAWEGMMRLNKQTGTAILLVTHDVALARRMDRVIELRNGRVVDDS